MGEGRAASVPEPSEVVKWQSDLERRLRSIESNVEKRTKGPSHWTASAESELHQELLKVLPVTIAVLRESQSALAQAQQMCRDLADNRATYVEKAQRQQQRAEKAEAALAKAQAEAERNLGYARERVLQLEEAGERAEAAEAKLKQTKKRVTNILRERAYDLTKQACDECEQCSENVMCNYHSLLSELAGHVDVTVKKE